MVFDPFIATEYKSLWHRGFPLQLLKDKPKFNIKSKMINADVQANLWDVNPDIDAINRLSLSEENYKFKNNFFYSSNKISPFNSQNTILKKEALKNYFLFPFIGRMDDIWGSYYLQSLGYKVIYGPSTVAQERNPHNTYNDFKGELIGYNNNHDLIKDLKKNPNLIKKYLPERSLLAFKRYTKILK